jgi:hypothetical protein
VCHPLIANCSEHVIRYAHHVTSSFKALQLDRFA